MKYLSTLVLCFFLTLTVRMNAQCNASNATELAACMTSSPVTINLTQTIALSANIPMINGGQYTIVTNGFDIIKNEWDFSNGNTATKIFVMRPSQPMIELPMLPSGTFSIVEWNFNNQSLNAYLSTLPLALKSFKAQKAINTNKLTWVTAEEKNVSHFEVEKTDGKTPFIKMGEVKSTGGITSNDYQFIDETPSNVVYYRLKMVDNDGSFKYSAIKTVEKSKNTEGVKVYPTLVNSNMPITIETQAEVKNVVLFNSVGQVIKTFNNNTNLDISEIQRGIYFIRLSAGDETKTVKIFKQ